MIEELNYLREKLTHPVINKLQIRSSKILRLNTLEPHKTVQYPDPATIYSHASYPDL